jgi:phosphoenolpyruvate carboxykinase (ATP)
MDDSPRAVSSRRLSQLEELDIRPSKISRNLPVPQLIEIAIQKGEGTLSSSGGLSVKTGKFTGRSPDDRYLVDDETTHEKIDWGKINHPISPANFEKIFNRMKKHVQGKEFYVFDGFVGADPDTRLAIRVMTDTAWHSLFANQIFIRPSEKELKAHDPRFTLLSANDFGAIPDTEGTRTETFIILNFKKRIILIGSTSYAGEIKKAMFSTLNYLLPQSGVFPMHCSANVGKDGNSALFFGLSGTGKTTLSADQERRLVGDDEHGWSDSNIFNFEGGCYAKCINLKKESEPQIWNAIRFGTVMENVVVKNDTREPDFSDDTLTENTRAAYPLEFIPNSVIPSLAGHPKVIIFLTADAFGVMPPIAKLSKEAAMYHFMSGYTSKLAGTERGITEPKETFSQCFGAPFMPLHAKVYADMLGRKIDKYRTKVFLVNTGWSGGPYGVGRRISLTYTRAMIRAALTGGLDKTIFVNDGIFNLEIPLSCTGVPTEILDPKSTWPDKKKYESSARRLAKLFTKNFEKFGKMPKEIQKAGPSGAGDKGI